MERRIFYAKEKKWGDPTNHACCIFSLPCFSIFLFSNQKHLGTLFQCFRQLTFIAFPALVKLVLRKEKSRFPEESVLLSGKRSKERTKMSNNKNNQINVPQAREAMDRFKMQAAQDEGVLFTS